MSSPGDRVRRRLLDIADAISHIERLLENRTFADLEDDRILRAAYERFIEIISEAYRHVPPELQSQASHVPWHRIRAIGNSIRHAYGQIDVPLLWNIHATGDLATLRDAVEMLIDQNSQTGPEE